MKKKPFLEDRDQQDTVTESALFRMWNHFKEKNATEKQNKKNPSSDEHTKIEFEHNDGQKQDDSELKTEGTVLDPSEVQQEPISEKTESAQVSAEMEQPHDHLQELKSEESKELEEPVDACIQLKISKDNMTASAVVLPPKNGGADITEEMVIQCLKENNILEEFFCKGIKMLCTFQLYNKSAVVAKGKPPVDGTDGSIEELFPREQGICLKTDENGLVDYKNLNKLRIIKKGTVICRITLPKPPADGKNLFGKDVHGRPGMPAKVRVGKNMALSKDETELAATCDGNLRFERGEFCIDDTLHIPGDIDNAIGNLDFCGDIIIDGGVREGFSVQSDKNISIKSAVEGSFINAKGNITLNKGINGMGRGLLRAGGDVKCKFLENCTVNADGSVIAECIINSRVTAEDEILVESGKGTIVGGTCTARNRIKARSIGSSAYVATTVALGASPEIISQKKQLKKKIDESKKIVDGLEKNCSYLERAAKRAPLPKVRASQLAQMKKQRMLSSIQISIDTKQLLEIDELIESLDSCQLSCHQIFPPVKILMANESLQIKIKETNRLYYYQSGEIKAGNI